MDKDKIVYKHSRVKLLANVGRDAVLKYYRKQKTRDAARIPSDSIYKATSVLFATLKTLIEEKEYGVFLKGLGYFGVMAEKGHPVKRRNMHQSFPNLNLDQTRYRIMFFPDNKEPFLKYYRMEQGFSVPLAKKVSENINGGKQYKFLLHSMGPMLGRKNDNELIINKIRSNYEKRYAK